MLDNRLPNLAFKSWLELFLSTTKTKWEINDCGEQDGSGLQETVPLCAAAEITLAPGEIIYIYIAMATAYKERIELLTPPALRDATLWIAPDSSCSI